MSEETDPPKPAGKPATPSASPRPWAFSADGLKSWAEGISAAIKALLYAGALWLAVFAAGKLIWREETTHPLHVEVSKEVQTALISHGGDVDLSLALQDALNERVDGVHEIIAVQGLKVVGAGDDAQAVSFKPFGVEVTTDDITRLINTVANRPPPPSVRLELLCAPGACDSHDAHPTTLVMTLSAPGGTRRALYPLSAGTAALRRSLRQAIQNTADLVLEESEPGLASVWFLNRSAVAGVSIPQFVQDLARAVGAAEKARLSESARDCVADLVIGDSLMFRQLFRQGFEVEQRAYGKASAECRINAETNVVFALLFQSYCNGNPDTRATLAARVREAVANLAAFEANAAPEIAFQRITAVRLETELWDLLQHDGAETLANYCANKPAPQSGSAGRFAGPLVDLMRKLKAELPVHPAGAPGHLMVTDLWNIMHATLPRSDLEGRIRSEIQLLNMILGYIETDPNPRAFDIIAGEAAMDTCDAIIAALDRPEAEQHRIAFLFGAKDSTPADETRQVLLYAYDNYTNAARVLLENARATPALPLIDLPDADTLSLLGNAYLMAGAPYLAAQSYKGVVDAFVLANEPVDQFPATADALARWASLRIAQGACRPGGLPDTAWTSAWQGLGTDAPGVCKTPPDKPGQGRGPANLPSLRALVTAELQRCPGPDTLDGTALDNATRWTRLVACSDSAKARARFVQGREPADQIDAELTQALATRP